MHYPPSTQPLPGRECFLDILTEESGEFVLEQCSDRSVRVWDEGKADWRRVPIALMALRRTYPGGDTVGVKTLRRG